MTTQTQHMGRFLMIRATPKSHWAKISAGRVPQQIHRHPMLTLLATLGMLAAILRDFMESVVLTGLLSNRVGAKPLVSFGFLALAPLLILLRFVNHYSETQVALPGSLLLLIGVALNLLVMPAFTEATYTVDDREAAEPGVFGPRGAYAQAFALMTIAYATGSLIGPFVGGFLAEWIGWNSLTLASGITCGLCSLPCLYATGGRGLPVQRSGERDPGS